MRNKGFYLRNDVIYVQGTIDNIFYRKSTGKKATKDNIAYVKKHYEDVLLKLIVKDEEKEGSIYLEKFGLKVLENTSIKRGLSQQKEVISKFRRYIVPHFKNFNIQDIKTSDIEYWQSLLSKDLSSSSVKKCRAVLNIIFKKAAADDIILKNYVSLSDNIQSISKKKKPYTKEELRLLLEHSSGWFRIYLILAMSLGLRVGELVGLQWDDIDLNTRILSLKRSISKGIIIDEKSITNKTKNHQRLVPLNETCVKELATYHQKRLDNTWVFVNAKGKPFYDGANINKYYWKPLLAKLLMEDKSMYALRHSFVSIMKNSGVSDAWLKSVIGHKQSSKVLEDVYFTFDNKLFDLPTANNFFSYLKEETN